jgi:hypothetical protein
VGQADIEVRAGALDERPVEYVLQRVRCPPGELAEVYAVITDPPSIRRYLEGTGRSPEIPDSPGAGAAAVGDGHRGRRLLINPGLPNSEVNALLHPPDDFTHLTRMFLLSSTFQEEEFGERNEQRKARRGEKK